MNHTTMRPTLARTFTWVPLLGGLVVIALGLSADCHGQLARQSREERSRTDDDGQSCRFVRSITRELVGRTCFNIIAYKRRANHMPDIICLEFDWEEVR